MSYNNAPNRQNATFRTFRRNGLHLESLEQRMMLAGAASCAIDADLDNSGVVDRADLAILASNYGLAAHATPDHGDLDGDGKVALSDLPLLRNEMSDTRIDLTSTRIQEGREFRLRIDNGVDSSLIDVDILHDSCDPVYEYGFLETDALGNADISLLMPTPLITSAATEDGFRIRIMHGGLNRLFRVTIVKPQDISVSPSMPRDIREGDPFFVSVERGIGHSEVDVDLFHDGPEPVHDFGFHETNEDGSANFQLTMPRGMLTAIHHDICTRDEDTFRIRVVHGGAIEFFSVRLLKGLEICVKPSSNFREGNQLWILIRNGSGNAEVCTKISLDGAQRWPPLNDGEHCWRNPGTDGSGYFYESISVPDLVGGGGSDRFELTVTHGGISPVFGITIYDSNQNPPPADPPPPRPVDPINPEPVVAGITDHVDFPVGIPDGTGYSNGGPGDTGWGFLEDTGSVYHPGEDWNRIGANDFGDPVHAIAPGLVLAAGNFGSAWGNIVLIQHDLPSGERVWSQYAHLQNDGLIAQNATVARGTQVGRIGTCGVCTGPHLHFEIRKVLLSPSAWVYGMSRAEIRQRYYEPTVFINDHRGARAPAPLASVAPAMVDLAISTFRADPLLRPSLTALRRPASESRSAHSRIARLHAVHIRTADRSFSSSNSEAADVRDLSATRKPNRNRTLSFGFSSAQRIGHHGNTLASIS